MFHSERIDLKKKQLTTAIKWDRAVAIFLMEGDLYVCSAIEDLSEGQCSHIAPVLEGRADRHLDICLLHVRRVVVDAVGQTLLSPATCKRRICLKTQQNCPPH